ncbi:methanogenesis marker 8 protein [Methanocrinis sp.]|uniref:methanogenesis marker 8 protein n=1 Tax=Methanocrinis sp. TaxID=3101522 RepID=UPI003D0D2005
MDEMELLGKTKVRVEGEKAVETGEPLIRWCPLFDKVRGIKEITPQAAAANMEFRIKEHGMFTPKRKLEMDVFVGFGASEVMMTATSRGLIDGAVTVCDGAGTVITSNPSLIQGMGGWISGLVETDPIPEVLAGIEERGGTVLDPKTAKIDQVAGARLAAETCSKFAVTVADADAAEELRRLEEEKSVQILIVGVHLTGIGEEDADRLIAAADIVTSCASKFIREKVRPQVQVGTAVPLFGLTRWGKEVLVERAKEVDRPILINTMPLPVLPENKQPRPLV